MYLCGLASLSALNFLMEKYMNVINNKSKRCMEYLKLKYQKGITP
jgi:hypothetical protein